MKKIHQKKLWSSQIKILKEIDRICRRYKISYFLIFGTLLGAVRHKGYIPWDDDLDIGMLREDYEKFLQVASKELKEEFIISHNKNNHLHWLSFAKVRLKDTLMVEEKSKHLNINQGIWVDIFPFDNVNKPNSLGLKIRKKIFDISSTLIAIKLDIDYYEDKKKEKYLKFWVKFVNLKFLHFINNYVSKMNKNNKSKYICSFQDSIENCLNPLLREKVIPLRKIVFENDMYNVPSDYDYILKRYYGNYMQLPDKKDRITHNPLVLKFEDGETINFEEIDKLR